MAAVTAASTSNFVPPKPPDIPIKTFADIVSGKKKSDNFIEIKEPTTFKGEPAVFFTEEEVNQLAEPFKFALVGKFHRGRPTMITIRNFFTKLGLRADYKVGLLDSNHILIHLHNEEDYHRIWLRKQWNIFQYPMTISKWHVNFTPENESPIVPIWVSMPYLPPHMYREDALMSLAKTIGNPMRIDNSTATLARPSRARVCIEVDISKTLPKRSYVGQGDKGFWQYFQYEEVPPYCNECYKAGHESSKCIMKTENNKKQDNTETLQKHTAQNKAEMKEQKGKQKQIYIKKASTSKDTKESMNNEQPSQKQPEMKENLEKGAENNISTQNRYSFLLEEGKEGNNQKIPSIDEDNQERQQETNNEEHQISILQRGDSLAKLLERKANSARKAKSLIKRMTEKLHVSDDEDTDEDKSTPSIQELISFSKNLQIPEIKGSEEENDKELIEESWTNVTRRKKTYFKNPELQRNTRSTVRTAQNNITSISDD